MARHEIARRATSGTVTLRRPELVDSNWLKGAVQGSSSAHVAAALEVSQGTVTTAYRRAGIDPSSTTRLFARGRMLPRPSDGTLHSAWEIEGSYRGVGQRFGVAHSTAAVWLAEVGVYADDTPALSRNALLHAIEEGQSMMKIATEHRVAVTTVRVELHRHGLFESHRNRHQTHRL